MAKKMIVTVSSENRKDVMRIKHSELLFFRSADNYVEVHRASEGEIETLLLRSTLKRIEKMLRHDPAMFRCHRSYLVNLRNITRLEGSSQQARLIFGSPDCTVPVSRKRFSIMKEKFRGLAAPE